MLRRSFKDAQEVRGITGNSSVNSVSLDIPYLHKPHVRSSSNRRRALAIYIFMLLALVAIVVVGLLLSTGNPAMATATDFTAKNLPPGWPALFGTDWMGRDMLSRTLSGLSTSILVGLLAACASSLIALLLGIIAALGGKRADTFITWLIDLALGIPHIILLVLIAYAIGKGFWGVAVGVAVTHWPNLARVIRAEVLQCRQSLYLAQARKFGSNALRIAWQHVIPHVLPQFLIGLVLMFPHAILHEAALTFLGFGLLPEQPAIGNILSESMIYLSSGAWWLAVFPGASLLLIVLLFNSAASNLRHLIDPFRAQE